MPKMKTHLRFVPAIQCLSNNREIFQSNGYADAALKEVNQVGVVSRTMKCFRKLKKVKVKELTCPAHSNSYQSNVITTCVSTNEMRDPLYEQELASTMHLVNYIFPPVQGLQKSRFCVYGEAIQSVSNHTAWQQHFNWEKGITRRPSSAGIFFAGIQIFWSTFAHS